MLNGHGWNSTASAASATERSAKGNSAGVLAAIAKHVSNRPLTICSDVEGSTTSNPQLTGRSFYLQDIEIIAVGSYLEGVVGFSHANHKVLRDIDVITRGGKIPFLCGIDANKNKADWSEIMWGDKSFLDHVGAEILEVTNSLFTCRGKSGTAGGSMIDYFIIFRSLLGLVLSVLADFSSECAPHYGIELVIRATAKDIENLELAKPSMPKELAMYDADAFEENSFQAKGKATCKLDQKRQREAKFEEVRLRISTTEFCGTNFSWRLPSATCHRASRTPPAIK